MFCMKCGKELKDESKFCTACGAENPMPDTDNTIIPDTETSIINSVVSKKKILIIVFSILIVLISIAAVLCVTVFNSVESLCEKGEYQKAYEKADEDEKIDIYYENVAAVLCAYEVSSYKDPDSFNLREVYYFNSETTEDNNDIVIRAFGNNSYGGKVSSYSLYMYNGDTNAWEYQDSYYDFEAKEISDYDDIDEQLDKLIYNLGIDIVKETVQHGTKLNKESVERINNHFKEGRLDEIELIDID